jgi:NADH-quinone oxidoreductase subunit F
MPEVLTLEQRKERFTKTAAGCKPRIVVCAGTGCMAGGAMKIYNRFREALNERGLTVQVALESEQSEYSLAETGCQGFCQMGPLVTIMPQGILHVKVKPEDVDEIVDKTLIEGDYVQRLLYTLPDSGKPVAEMNKIPFY